MTEAELHEEVQLILKCVPDDTRLNQAIEAIISLVIDWYRRGTEDGEAGQNQNN